MDDAPRPGVASASGGPFREGELALLISRKGRRHLLQLDAAKLFETHTGILPHHTIWIRIFENLKYVVIDELHHYRGVFGSHLANVMRRLKRICAFYGSHPQFICCSATIANPKEMAEKIIEKPVELIDDNGAPRGERHFLFYNPPVDHADLAIRRPAVK